MISFFQVFQWLNPFVEVIQNILNVFSFFNRILSDSCEFRAEFSQFWVESGFDILMELILNFQSFGIDDNTGELDDLRTGLKLDIVLAGGLKIQNQQVFDFREIFLVLVLHILQL